MGLFVNGAKSYGQVPGLKLHFDGRYNKGIIPFSGVPIVNTWGSLTGDVVANAPVKSTQMEDDSANFVHFGGTGTQTKALNLNLADKSEYNFLHNGLFGVFGIINFTFTSGSGVVSLLRTYQADTTIGFQLRLATNYKFRFLLQDGDGGFPSPSIEPAATLTPGQTHSYGLVRRSTANANNLLWYLDNVNHQTNSITQSYAGDVTQPVNIANMFATLLGDMYYGKLLVYDWSGFSEAQIDAFSLQVRTLLEVEKPLFTI